MGRAKKPQSGDEERVVLNTLKEILTSKSRILKEFAKEKLDAYRDSEVLKSGVRVKVFQDVKAPMPIKGDNISVKYIGYRADGKIFDAGNIDFVLGVGEVITAWDKAFKMVKVGQKATIFCPSQTAYGKHGAGKLIPPYTTLIFDITLEQINS